MGMFDLTPKQKAEEEQLRKAYRAADTGLTAGAGSEEDIRYALLMKGELESRAVDGKPRLFITKAGRVRVGLEAL